MEIIVGAAVSVLVQFLKKYSKNEYQTLTIALVVSLAAAAGYTILASTSYWNTFLMILGTAGAIYTYIIARFEA